METEKQKRFYEDGGYPQCATKCIVGELGRARICCCELSAEHAGECERIPTRRLAGAGDFSLKWYRNLCSSGLASVRYLGIFPG
jgi:hypothetical protein